MPDRPARRTRIALLFAALAFAIAPRSEASEGALHLHVDWDALGRLIHDLEAGTPTDASRAHPDASHARVVEETRSKWFATDGAFVSLVARNWEGASRLAGGPMPATDAIRVSRSSRLIVGRIALTGGKIVPFLQLGLGQWRDPDQHVYDAPLEFASQLGGGFDITHLTRHCALALEYDWTRAYGASEASVERAARTLGWGEAFAVVRFDLDGELFASAR